MRVSRSKPLRKNMISDVVLEQPTSFVSLKADDNMMEEVAIGDVSIPQNPSEDSFDEDDGFQPPAERWAPIGASATSDSGTPTKDHESGTVGRLKELEDEQEQLNASLLAMTTHFAQVQFRLQQISKAQPDDKEILLKDLEEFAFKGCPDIMEVKKKRTWHSNDPGESTAEHQAIMEQQRAKQLQLIGQLKDQLEDVERFAFESGQGSLPTGELMEKQKLLIDQLKDRIELGFDESQWDKLSHEDIQKHVDSALKRLINPMKVKEQLVTQLKTQITDLERFIDFLQGEGVSGKTPPICTCSDSPDSEASKNCAKHSVYGKLGGNASSFGFSKKGRDRSESESVVNLITMYILSQMGCQSRKFQKNELKKTSKGNHWGDLRAELEVSVDKLIEVLEKHENDETPATLNPYNSDEEDVDDVFEQCHEEIVTCVRKDLCPALRDLLQHGLIDPANSQLGGPVMSSFGCFPARSRGAASSGTAASAGSDQPKMPVHAWDVVLQYYEMKHGREYSDAPVRKLSQSFNLENIGGRAVTSKQILLSTIDNIVTSHTKLKRSQDAMFKAFVSAALNHRKLVPWLRMILRTREIVEENYYFWSYVSRTGFDDSFAVLEKLNRFTFRLPVDLAVRPFQHIKDAF